MKAGKRIFYAAAVLLMAAGCAEKEAESGAAIESTSDSSVADTTQQLETTESIETTQMTEDSSEIANGQDSTESASSEAEQETTEEADLSQYTAEEIEYARIWLQLGPNQEIDELYVQRIPAGTLINPLDETSAVYPEEVIQLAGGRMVDGSVTYSGNGDGTINVYNVPLKWERNPSPEADETFMKKYTEEIIETTELIYVEPAIGKEVVRLIELLQVQ